MDKKLQTPGAGAVKKLIALLLAAALLACLSGCGAGDPSRAGPVFSPSGRDEAGNWIFDRNLFIGRVAPLTGSLASFGEGSPFIEEQAIAAVNQAGGIVLDGQRCRLVLLTEDSASETTTAKKAAQSLIDRGVSMMLAAHTADVVAPVSSVCERAGIACITVDAPAEAWVSNGPYENCWHTHFGTEAEILSFHEAWESIETNRRIGLVTANDIEGIEMATFIEEFAAAKGYELVDTVRYSPGMSYFSDIVDTMAAKDCDIVLGVMEPQDFIAFWRECRRSDYQPKICTVAKACLFSSSVEALGAAADGLVTEVWWSQDFPYVSSLTGQTCMELADEYREYAGLGPEDRVPPVIGPKHANVEIACDILKRAGTLDLDAINAAAASTELDAIVGHVSFSSQHVSIMNCVTGQWQLGGQGKLELEIVFNTQLPEVETTSEIYPLPGWGKEDEK